jgi:tRNA(Leu) C34 or U34 (ribose-2'-O)-methylase TrmL
MIDGSRCLNLATTVGIVTYEAWRQNGFALNPIC